MLPPSVTRLWRPAAQRNLRNQWSKLASYKSQWVSSSAAGRSHATSLVNTDLSLRYCQLIFFLLYSSFLLVLLWYSFVVMIPFFITNYGVSYNGRNVFRYIPSMELGVLSDMLDLRNKASAKLLIQQVSFLLQFLFGIELKQNSCANMLTMNLPGLIADSLVLDLISFSFFPCRSFIGANSCHLTGIWYVHFGLLFFLFIIISNSECVLTCN